MPRITETANRTEKGHIVTLEDLRGSYHANSNATYTGCSFNVEINTRAKTIRIFGKYGNRLTPETFDRTFSIGDTAEYDSFNLSYYGSIETITEKGVMIKPKHGTGRRRLCLGEFIDRNWDFSIEKANKRNNEWND